MYDLHGTECHFVHGRIIGAVTGFATGGITGALSGAIVGGRKKAQPQLVPTDSPFRRLQPTSVASSRPTFGRTLQRAAQRACKLAPNPQQCRNFFRESGGEACQPPLVLDQDGVTCVFPGSPADISLGGALGGVTVMGRYGAAMVPETEQRLHRECLPGMVLGDDNNCYNRRDLKNSERKYPKGRAPLLTGGERNAITKAARAARKIQRTEKQLRKLGMLKAPTRRAAPKPKLLLPGDPGLHGGTRIINVD